MKARILEPEAYGIIALVMVFTNIFQVFVDCGLGNALIQKKDADDIDFSSVFYFNIVWCLLLYTRIALKSFLGRQRTVIHKIIVSIQRLLKYCKTSAHTPYPHSAIVIHLCCIMSLSYRVTFLCKGCSKLIIHQKVLYDTFFIKKLVKWCIND